MFRLLRYFSLTAGIALVAVAIILVIFYRQTAIQDLVDITERQNAALARLVCQCHLADLCALRGLGRRARRRRIAGRATKRGSCHETLRRLTTELPVLKVKIYSLERVDGLFLRIRPDRRRQE